MSTRRAKRSPTRKFLEELIGGSLTLGEFLVSIREGEGLSQAEFARKLGISRSHLCDVEKGRKTVSLARAARFAEILGYGEAQFVRLALQGMLEEAGLPFRVDLRSA